MNFGTSTFDLLSSVTHQDSSVWKDIHKRIHVHFFQLLELIRAVPGPIYGCRQATLAEAQSPALCFGSKDDNYSCFPALVSPCGARKSRHNDWLLSFFKYRRKGRTSDPNPTCFGFVLATALTLLKAGSKGRFVHRDSMYFGRRQEYRKRKRRFILATDPLLKPLIQVTI